MSVQVVAELDTEKFRKVHSLMTGGATPGERSAAKDRAGAMAAKAGMSLTEAVSSLSAKPAAPKAKSFFDDMEDAMEAAHPGYKAERAASKSEAQRKREAAQVEILKEYGSEEAVWAETERERLLRETLEPLADWGTYGNMGASPGGKYIAGFAGWTVGRPTPKLFEALMKAYPFPTDVAGLWQEFQEWERIYEIRSAFCDYGGADQTTHVRARIAALEFNLDTLSDPTFDGFACRLEWLKFRFERDLSTDIRDDLAMVDAMRIDLAMLRATHTPKGGSETLSPSPAQTGQRDRTRLQKQADVLSMLDAHPELSDREIARRLGVSPQTVSTWRKKR